MEYSRRLLEKPKNIENEMDLIDGEYGGENKSYCFWCNSTEYNGEVGIIHTKTCVKQQVRDKIKNENI